jgi:hypothetical protein
MRLMKISDSRGRSLDEVVVRLEVEEVTELLVAASQLEDGSQEHAVVGDDAGNIVALYKETGEAPPLQRHFDWWLGPLILLGVILMLVGAFTIARGVVRLLF